MEIFLSFVAVDLAVCSHTGLADWQAGCMGLVDHTSVCAVVGSGHDPVGHTVQSLAG